MYNMQKLMGYLSGVWDFCPGATEFERGFQAALILAALIFLLLIVLGLILKIVFRKPAVPGVTLEREDGDIFISRSLRFPLQFHRSLQGLRVRIRFAYS